MSKAPDNIVSRTLRGETAPKKVQHKESVWVEGRWVFYAPTFSPSLEVKEWGGRWDNKKQAWRLPRLTRWLRRIAEYDQDATFTRDAKRLRDQDWAKRDAEVMGGILDLNEAPLFDNLYPYQKEAVYALTSRPYHGNMLILSPGLGKTPSSIVAGDIFMQEFGESQRALIVAPLSLVYNWEREIKKWSNDPRVEVVHQDDPTPDRSVRWTVTNYDTLGERIKDPNTGQSRPTGNLKEEWNLDWDIVIFDESVLLKNRKTKRTSVARTLARSAKKVWLLSGAPITHDNSDMYAQMNILEPDYFTAFWRFTEECCVVSSSTWSQWNIDGSRHDFSFRKEYPELCIVRNQEEVFEDLPTYIYQDVELKLHKRQQRAHDEVLNQWVHELEERGHRRVEVTAVIAMLVRLQQITSNLYNLETTGTKWPDYSAKADFVEELCQLGEVEWPMLVWVHHRPGAEALLQRLRKMSKSKQHGGAMYGRRVEKVVGGTKNIDKLVEEFKAGEIDVLLFGITVGKYGHTLANAHTVVTYDKTWDSDAWFQMLHRAAGARAKIGGFTHRPLLINPRCRGTVDDFVELNLAGKLPAMADMTGSDLAKILRSLGKEHVA